MRKLLFLLVVLFFLFSCTKPSVVNLNRGTSGQLQDTLNNQDDSTSVGYNDDDDDDDDNDDDDDDDDNDDDGYDDNDDDSTSTGGYDPGDKDDDDYDDSLKVSLTDVLVVKDCSGTYIRYEGKDYQVCNFELLKDFANGTSIKIDFETSRDCDNPAFADLIVCMLYHENEGWIKISKIY